VHERLVQLGPAFPADAKPAEEVPPGEGPLDDPAQLAQAGAVLGVAPGDDGLDATLPQLAAVLVVVIAAVGDELLRLPPVSVIASGMPAVSQIK
jgi:hypothetical protein